MKPKIFMAEDGRKVMLRPPKWEDLEGLMKYINSLVEEKAEILLTKKVTREEETEWLATRLVSIDKGDILHFVAEVNGEIVAGAEVGKQKHRMNHVGILGIGIKHGFRGIGIGTIIMRTLIEESRKAGLKIIVLDVFDTNHVAKKLYKKIGFEEVGKIPKGVCKNGEYVDLIRMALEL